MSIFRKFVQSLLPLAIAFWLLRYVYRDFQLKELSRQLQAVNFNWIMLSVLISLASHAVRAYRWQLLLQALGFKLSLYKAFTALMVGYVSNLIVPRLGEIVRCTVLKNTTGIPTAISIGTVVGERTIDLFSLIILVVSSLAIVFKQLKELLYKVIFISLSPMVIKALCLTVFLLVALSWLLFLAIKRKPDLQKHPLWLKIKSFLQELLTGLYSIKSLNAKNTFLFLTVFIWVLYYFVGYVGFFALAETSELSWKAGMAVLLMSTISITLPVQGAIGAYHWLVSSTLLVYGISQETSMLYVTFSYVAQLLSTLVVGVFSIVLNSLLFKKISYKQYLK